MHRSSGVSECSGYVQRAERCGHHGRSEAGASGASRYLGRPRGRRRLERRDGSLEAPAREWPSQIAPNIAFELSTGRDRTVRTVVVGASSGLGRCIGVGLAKRGAQTALLARRLDRLEAAAKEAGPGAIALACDVTDPESCGSALAEAARQLGGID